MAAKLSNIASTLESPYKERSTLNKAVKRVMAKLPSSPQKHQKVVTILAKKHGIDLVMQKSQTRKCNKIPEEVMEQVRCYYRLDDISWQAPGKKGYVIVLKDGTKERIKNDFCYSL